MGTDKRELLMQAALKLFEEKGYHGTKVSDIVRSAGVAQGTFYLYYQSKEDIFRAAAEQCLGEIGEAFAQDYLCSAAKTGADPEEEGRSMAQLLRRMLTIYYNNRGILSSMNRYGTDVPELKEVLNSFYSSVADYVKKAFQAHDVYPEYTDRQLEMAAYACIGMVEMTAYQWMVERHSGLECVEELTDVLLEFLLPGAAELVKRRDLS